MPDNHPQTVQFYHLSLSIIDTANALDYIFDAIRNDSIPLMSIFFLNAHCFNLSVDNEEYQRALKNCTMLLNDGIGIKIASKLKGIDLVENMNGTDFIPKIIKKSSEYGHEIFLLGGEPGVSGKAGSIWRESYPNIKICGTHSGFFDDDKVIVDLINKSNAKILVVGMGVPKQEIWLHNNAANLTSVSCAIAGGAIFDFTSGKFRRAPIFLQKFGLEWAYRLIQEPKRLFTRYVVGNIKFLSHVILKR